MHSKNIHSKNNLITFQPGAIIWLKFAVDSCLAPRVDLHFTPSKKNNTPKSHKINLVRSCGNNVIQQAHKVTLTYEKTLFSSTSPPVCDSFCLKHPPCPLATCSKAHLKGSRNNAPSSKTKREK